MKFTFILVCGIILTGCTTYNISDSFNVVDYQSDVVVYESKQVPPVRNKRNQFNLKK